MAKRIDLRAYQEAIANRLAAAQTADETPALLAFESGGRRWLLDLPATGEVLPLPRLTPVPLTQPWYTGLANVHGELTGVIDFAVYCGQTPTAHHAAARILCVGARFGSNVALLVSRVFGLKHANSLFPVEGNAPALADWCTAAFTDPQGERWLRLEPRFLLTDPALLDAALPET